jgi:hypothetical protein
MSTISTIKNFAGRPKQFLTKEEENHIRENYMDKSKRELAVELNTTIHLVGRFLDDNNLKRIRKDYNVEEKFRNINMELNGHFNVFATDNWLV